MNTPPQDDDRTAVPGTTVTSPAEMPPAVAGNNALPLGTRLDEFEVTGLIGEGGFGIVYEALDHSLGRHVAIKEYMPSALAARAGAMTVSVRSPRYAETFATGLRSFINEARLLAQFDHPSLLKVYRFWEANGTAYMAMPHYEGTTLKDVLQRLGGPPDERWLKDLLRPLLDALALIHGERCFHRDISPDNILVLTDGRPVLLDFGAARRVIGDMSHALTVILKPGYAPVEQYGEMSGMAQGAWTDLYALAAVVYFAITGSAPLPSVSRMVSDALVPLSRLAAGRYEDGFLRGIDRALAMRPEDRPQDAAEMRVLLGLGDRRQQPRQTRPDVAAHAAVRTQAPMPATPAAPRTPTKPTSSATTGPKPVAIYVAAAAIIVGLVGGAFLMLGERAKPEAINTAKPNVASPPATPPMADEQHAPPAPILPPVAEPTERIPAVVARKHPAPAAVAAAPRMGAQTERCSDILERKSLGEPLTDEEQATLRRDCR